MTSIQAYAFLVMDWVNGAVGTGYITRQQVLPAVAQELAWRTELPPDLQSAQFVRPAMDHYDEVREGLGAVTDDHERAA